MTCFFIATPWGDDGISEHFRIVAQGLVQRGHTVVILTNQQAVTPTAPGENPVVYGWPSPRPTHPRDLVFLFRLIRRYRPDCLIATFGAGNAMMLVGWLAGVPQRIIWYRTLLAQIMADSARWNWKTHWLIARKALIYRLSTVVVANSAASEADVQRIYRVPASKTTHFYNLMIDPLEALSLPRVDDSARRSILCVGRLAPSKGQDVIIRALSLLASRFPSIQIEFIGVGSNREALIELARRLDVLDRCQFTGRLSRAEVLDKMNRALFTLVPSRNEAFGRVVVESLAVGTPVIASNVGGIREVIRDGVEGYLVAPDDVAAFAERIAQLVQDAALCRQMGLRARQRFLQTFEQSTTASRLLDWLKNLTEPPASSQTK